MSESRQAQPIVAAESRIRVLDGWRGVSVLFVVFGHLVHHSALASQFDRSGGAGLLTAFLGTVLGSFAPMGVNIFFCLSGYVICLGLMKEEERSGAICLSAFYVRRFFRIFPPLWIYLGALAALQLIGVLQGELGGIVRAALFLYNIPSADAIGARFLTAHTWSLAFEEQFYIAFPSLFALIASRTRLWVFLVGTIGLAFGGLFINWLKFGGWAQFGYCFSMLTAGVSFCLLQHRLDSRLIAFGRTWHPVCFTVCCLIWLLPAGRLGTLVQATIGMPILVFTVLGSILWSNKFTELLSARWLVGVGRVSYGLYLWQQLFTARWEGAGWLIYLCGFIVLSVIVWLSYHFIEMPLVGVGKRVSDGLRDRKLAKRRLAGTLP